jgi:hypothetical protein
MASPTLHRRLTGVLGGLLAGSAAAAAAQQPRQCALTAEGCAAAAAPLPRLSLGLEGKVVVVTGASKGIGEAIVRQFAAEGAHLHLVSRTKSVRLARSSVDEDLLQAHVCTSNIVSQSRSQWLSELAAALPSLALTCTADVGPIMLPFTTSILHHESCILHCERLTGARAQDLLRLQAELGAHYPSSRCVIHPMDLGAKGRWDAKITGLAKFWSNLNDLIAIPRCQTSGPTCEFWANPPNPPKATRRPLRNLAQCFG